MLLVSLLLVVVVVVVVKLPIGGGEKECVCEASGASERRLGVAGEMRNARNRDRCGEVAVVGRFSVKPVKWMDCCEMNGWVYSMVRSVCMYVRRLCPRI